MKAKKISKKLLVTFLLITFSANMISCTKRVLVPMNHFLEKENVLHVKLISGKEVIVKEPRFKDGVLTGLTPLYDTLSGPDFKITINVYEIKSISVDRIKPKKTIALITTIVVSIVTFFYLVRRAYCCWGES